MRLSAYRDSPHYNPTMIPAKVFLQGKEVRDCVYADEEKGKVIVILRDARGNIRHDGTNVLRTTLRGHVAIRKA